MESRLPHLLAPHVNYIEMQPYTNHRAYNSKFFILAIVESIEFELNEDVQETFQRQLEFYFAKQKGHLEK